MLTAINFKVGLLHLLPQKGGLGILHGGSKEI
jgi:hypothetical protein